ncbi:SusD/RagB family nutrient-binding outer membrane lipoprotein [Mucilaginibacter rubeus]|uniref:SusD/RagB family nutrient-binding outer membrane lipoprotein n=1 Tax=Mucilaginibacter rubeus TaxID=2027860 RepID=A0AAE6JGS6_9SPHI|nr:MULTISPECIES: SusD/RagB family nutrient-binding outer membrane lipoprotein [Mucilaginibacter]QEM05248.1 SusD/RagB family nutrient-binding outer membrane lipoprotein [Mucilaginibacter rubeus]QEM17840.1 SusD/RagB family nutrient-binding outer membrane lipoprotein [Mucilaginibacter gossypii]QTE45629.1 SusD/RagB family nutrient-binding outer membrane lipoprotein [Mucilaginibacter rubeus]QTE52226.1 SusD/RagB family nutrient-binding outer membrane lipoprotein [Mucilaginibacter rubeus]QTE57314.1 S
MKLKYISILSAAVLLSVTSCKKDLLKINQNPNGSQTAQPDYLLTAATKATADTYWGVANNMDASLLFVQYWSKIQYTDPDRYIYASSAFEELWSTGYSKSIVNLNQIIKLADAQGNTNYKGVALVLRSWAFSLLTEAYGDIPYRQATNIDQYLTPAYDTQKDVYFALLDDLKAAQTALDPSGKAIAGDVIYSNNIASWKKFANSLRLRIALRIADREPAKAKQVLDDIKTEGGLYISSNVETAQLVYLDSPNQNPISNLFDTRDDYRISKTIVDKLFALNDPRLSIYAAKTQDVTPQTYVGLPNGLLVGDASNYGFTKTSKPGTYFRAPHAPAVILSYAESLFDRAEAAARGFTTEDAASLYGQAVTAALAQYSIASADIATYIAQPAVQYDASNYKKSIGEQKWLALFGQGLEGWTEWRRLDYPQLQPAVAGTLNGKIPVRFIYPGTEQSLNKTNYQSAVAAQGADALTTKLWFDVN